MVNSILMFSANLSGVGASAVGQSYERSIVFGRDEDRSGNNDISEKYSFNFSIQFNGAQLQNQMMQQQREDMNFQRQQSCEQAVQANPWN